MYSRKPVLATVLGRAFKCLVCGGKAFWARNIKMNSTGGELLGLAWADESAQGLICDKCGYVHQFAEPKPQLWKLSGGYPPEAE